MKSIEDILLKFGGQTRITLGLDRIKRALAAVGSPHEDVKTIVIGGTNGKGTTSLLLSHALAQHGIRVGTYLSPHLQHPKERMLVNLMPISTDNLDELGQSLFELGCSLNLTYFEFLTLLYFVWAKNQNVEISVLEVGMGGRLDATNVTTPQATILTNIGLDHQAFLGATRLEILQEKLGIARPNTPLFTGIEEPDLIEICQTVAKKRNFPFHTLKTHVTLMEKSWERQKFLLDGHLFEVTNPTVAMAKNAALTYQVIRNLFPEIPIDTIQKGFSRCRTPGRFELICESPKVILSGDHNREGLFSLFQTLDALPPAKLRVVCGFCWDKPYAEMYRMLSKRAETITLTTFPRYSDPLPEDYKKLGPFVPSAPEALRIEMERARPEDVVLVTGSLYLVGTIRSLFHPKVNFQ